MSYFSFEIPGEPRGKMRPKASAFCGHARVYTPAKQIEYENWVRQCYVTQGGMNMGDQLISVDMTIYQAMPKSFSKKKRGKLLMTPCSHKPDIDNVLKSILDSLNGIAYGDDQQVYKASVQRLWAETSSVLVVFEGIGE